MNHSAIAAIKNLWEKGGIVKAHCDPYGKSEFTLTISADRAGLMTLAKLLVYLAEFPDGYQFTLDTGGNVPFISNMPLKFMKRLKESVGQENEIFWDDALFQSATKQLQIIDHTMEEKNKLSRGVMISFEEGYWIKAQKTELATDKEAIIISANLPGIRTLAAHFLCLVKYEISINELDRLCGLASDSDVWIVFRRGLH